VFKIENVQASDADNAIRLRVYYTSTDFILSDPVALAVTQDNNLRSGHLVVARVAMVPRR
jgi:hypothetical protein